MAVLNLNKYLTEGAIEGYLPFVPMLTAFSYVVKPGPSSLNDNVRVPFVQANTASNQFTYGNGYNTDNTVANGQLVTMNNIFYGKISLSDSDLLLLNEDALVRIGSQIGGKLGGDTVSQSLASVVNSTNFTNTAVYPASSFSASVATIALDKQANDLKWPIGDDERNIIANTTFQQAVLNNSNINLAYAFGSSDPVQKAKLREFFGFNPYLFSLPLPNGDNAIAIQPDAILFANGYHAPTDQGTQYIQADKLEMDKGLTIGFRQYYLPQFASSYRVFDCLFGTGVGNANGLIHIQ